MSERRRLFRLPWRTARQIRADVDDELAFHLDMRVADLVAAGMGASEARGQAMREFGDIDDARRYIGNVDRATEAARQWSDLMGDLRQDLVYALRKLRTAPGFAAAVIATFALGIGATTAIFTVVDGVLLKPLPYPRGNRIVQAFQINAQGDRESVSVPNFRDWQAGTRSFSSIAVVGIWPQTITGLPQPVIAHTSWVTREFFGVFGVQPEVGRLFTAEETTFGGPRAIIVSDAFWRSQLGGSSVALGERLTMGGDTYSVIGVMPPPMTYPDENDIWIPMEPFGWETGRTSQGKRVVGRLRDGVTLDAARAEISALSRRLKQQYGNLTSMSDAALIPLRDQLVGTVKTPLLVLMAASAFLLLIACANALNLLLARLALRQGEMALRVALGATRGRLARQVLAESAVLVLLGAVIGVSLAGFGVRTMLASSTNLQRVGDVHVDLRVLAFAIVLSALIAVALGFLTTWHGARRDVRDSLSSNQRSMTGGASAARLRRGMVLTQMALTVVLLVGAGVLGRSFLRLIEVNPGFITERLLIVNAAPTIDDSMARLAYYNTLIERVRALPGVVAAGAVTGTPLDGGSPDGTYLLLETPAQQVTSEDWTRFPAGKKRHGEFAVVDGDYFGAMHIPLLRGRTFDPMRDVPNAPQSAVVSASFAQHTWPGENPLGKAVNYGNMDGDLHPLTIIGVVGDVHDESLAAPPTPTLYAYMPQRPTPHSLVLMVQTNGDPASSVPSIRSIVHQLRPDVAVRTRTVDRLIAMSVADQRFTFVLILAFGGTALLLSTLGVYSVVSYLVAQRTPEIGVRVALGAQRGDVLRLILREGARLAGAGVVIGVIGSVLLTRLLRGLIFGVSATDPIAFATAIALLIVVALAATYVPARRATQVDPMDVLRGV
jgi:putative ABC transport system permease protein